MEATPKKELRISQVSFKYKKRKDEHVLKAQPMHATEAKNKTVDNDQLDPKEDCDVVGFKSHCTVSSFTISKVAGRLKRKQPQKKQATTTEIDGSFRYEIAYPVKTDEIPNPILPNTRASPNEVFSILMARLSKREGRT